MGAAASLLGSGLLPPTHQLPAAPFTQGVDVLYTCHVVRREQSVTHEECESEPTHPTPCLLVCLQLHGGSPARAETAPPVTSATPTVPASAAATSCRSVGPPVLVLLPCVAVSGGNTSNASAAAAVAPALYPLSECADVFTARSLRSIVYFRGEMALDLMPKPTGGVATDPPLLLPRRRVLISLADPSVGKKAWRTLIRSVCMLFRDYWAHITSSAPACATPGFAACAPTQLEPLEEKGLHPEPDGASPPSSSVSDVTECVDSVARMRLLACDESTAVGSVRTHVTHADEEGQAAGHNSDEDDCASAPPTPFTTTRSLTTGGGPARDASLACTHGGTCARAHGLTSHGAGGSTGSRAALAARFDVVLPTCCASAPSLDALPQPPACTRATLCAMCGASCDLACACVTPAPVLTAGSGGTAGSPQLHDGSRLSSGVTPSNDPSSSSPAAAGSATAAGSASPSPMTAMRQLLAGGKTNYKRTNSSDAMLVGSQDREPPTAATDAVAPAAQSTHSSIPDTMPDVTAWSSAPPRAAMSVNNSPAMSTRSPATGRRVLNPTSRVHASSDKTSSAPPSAHMTQVLRNLTALAIDTGDRAQAQPPQPPQPAAACVEDGERYNSAQRTATHRGAVPDAPPAGRARSGTSMGSPGSAHGSGSSHFRHGSTGSSSSSVGGGGYASPSAAASFSRTRGSQPYHTSRRDASYSSGTAHAAPQHLLPPLPPQDGMSFVPSAGATPSSPATAAYMGYYAAPQLPATQHPGVPQAHAAVVSPQQFVPTADVGWHMAASAAASGRFVGGPSPASGAPPGTASRMYPASPMPQAPGMAPVAYISMPAGGMPPYASWSHVPPHAPPSGMIPTVSQQPPHAMYSPVYYQPTTSGATSIPGPAGSEWYGAMPLMLVPHAAAMPVAPPSQQGSSAGPGVPGGPTGELLTHAQLYAPPPPPPPADAMLPPSGSPAP